MSDYKDLKVADLKELLKQRELSTQGNKADLIVRLEEADASGEAAPHASADAAEKASGEEPTAVPTVADEAADTETTADLDQPSESAEADEVTAEPLTEEELKAQIIGELQTRIARNKKFGGETSELETQLRRIERFGAAAVRDAQQKANADKLRGSRRSGRRQRPNKDAGVAK